MADNPQNTEQIPQQPNAEPAAQPVPQTMPMTQVDYYIRNKHHFYKALVASGWRLPKYTTSIVTMDFLLEVRNGDIYCPKQVDVVANKHCSNPPTIEYLADLISKGLQNSLRDVGQDWAPKIARLAFRMEKKKPDVEWLLVVLAIFHPDNEIFKKGYVPPKRQSPYSPEMPLFNNSDQLLTNLPILSRKELTKGRGNIFMTKEEKCVAKLKAKTARLQAAQEAVRKETERLQKLREPKEDTFAITAAEMEELMRYRAAAEANPQRRTGEFGPGQEEEKQAPARQLQASPPLHGKRPQANQLMESAEKSPPKIRPDVYGPEGPNGPNIICNESDFLNSDYESSHADVSHFVNRELGGEDLNNSGLHSAQVRTNQRKKNAQKAREMAGRQ